MIKWFQKRKVEGLPSFSISEPWRLVMIIGEPEKCGMGKQEECCIYLTLEEPDLNVLEAEHFRALSMPDMKRVQ